MNPGHVMRAWGRILTGHTPTLSIEITKECPLRCPGCYAYEDAHLGGLINLRQLSDQKGNDLVKAVLAIVDREKPLHLSIVGGDPLVRFREIDELLPQLESRGIHVQVVTSAFREIPKSWMRLSRLRVVVSIDGLPAEHDERRKPATYERILKNIADRLVNIHCTITGQMMKRAGYLEEFLAYWSPRMEIRRILVSMFTPQRGAESPEILTHEERSAAIEQLSWLRIRFPKLDLPFVALREFAHPPNSPAECIFAQTTRTISADLKTHITPCQFGGDPDCSQCGCMASMGLAAIGNHKLAGLVPVRALFAVSARIGKIVSSLQVPRAPNELKVVTGS